MASEVIAHCSHQDSSSSTTYSYNRVPLKSRNFILKVQRTCKKFQEKPLPPEFKTRLDGPSAIWKVCSRLAMAIEYADSCTNDCMIFSFEEKFGNAGQRLFLVTSPQKMWAWHRAKPPDERCTYEVIRENYPCKLYFDLEFYTSFNDGKNGNHLTDIFIKCVIASMYEQHNLLLKESDFLWLDASNEEKFSSHLILQTKGVAFKNNIHAGTFVYSLTSKLKQRIEENSPSDELWPSAQEIKSLLIKSKKGKEIFFYDEGVYTKNRNFRIYLSTKLGKKSPLVLSSCNKYVPLVHPQYEETTTFYDSLITYFRSKKLCKILSYEENSQRNISKSPYSQISITKPGVSGCSSSPFPELDNFVLSIIKDEVAIGFIRKWAFISSAQKIIYDIGNYRFCGNIGRHHKSNNIKIIIDMKSKCYYQTCLDPECRQDSYYSSAVAVPEYILSDILPEEFFDENSFSELQSLECKIEENNEPDFSEELFKTSINEDFVFESNVRSYKTASEQNNISVNRTSSDRSLCQNMDLDFEDFSELPKANNNEVKATNHVQIDNCDKPDKEIWDAFFIEDFTSNEEKTEQRENGSISRNSFPLNDGGFWDSQPVVQDSAVSLGNLSFEDELLLAEAAEVVEATINESTFLEETMF